jgi:hypothetical protein
MKNKIVQKGDNLELKGLFELESALKKLNNTEEKEKDTKNEIIEELNKIFSKKFMIDNTHFDEVEDIFYYGGMEVKKLEDYSLYEIWTLDEVVGKYTNFKSWDEFIEAAKFEKKR